MRIAIENDIYRAVIDLSRGGNCISLRHKGTGARLLREPPEGELDNPYLYGMPILFPVNRISGGRFLFEGREYVFPINEPATGCHLHGTLHETPFALLEREQHRIVCGYRAREGEYLSFPHAFEIRMEYALTAAGLTHTTRVVNLSDMAMPVLLGFHTTFNACPLNSPQQAQVQVAIAEEYERNMKNYLPTGRKSQPDTVRKQLEAGSFDPLSMPISRHYRGAGPMQIRWGTTRLRYQIDEKLGFRLIYNGNADGYICLEPQTCLANCVNAPVDRQEGGFDAISPGEDRIYITRITLEEGENT